MFGCSGAQEQAEQKAAKQGAKGQYIEREIKIPLPEGYSEQYVFGVGSSENGTEVFTYVYAGTDDQVTVRYFRHTIQADGKVATADETWLNDLASDGGNEMRLQQADDGALYMSYSGYDENYNLVPHLLVSRDGGKTGESLNGDAVPLLAQANSFGILASGEIAITEYFNGNMYLLDAEGNMEQRLEGETNMVMPSIAAQGTKIAYIAKGAQSVCVLDTADGSTAEYPYAFAEQSTPWFAFAPDGSLLLCDATGVYRHSAGGSLWERIIDGSVTSLGLPSFYTSGLYVGKNGVNTIYVYGGGELLEYAYDASASSAASETLEIFSLYENATVRQAVVAFNRMQSDVTVDYTVAMNQSTGGTIQDYIKALNTELLAGKGPDVIILDGMPIDSYIEKGVLADISSAVDGAEEILPNIRAASASADGKLYAMPTRIKLPLAISGETETGTFGSLSTLADGCEQSGEIPLLASAAFSYQTLAEVLLTYYGEDVANGNAEDITAFLTDAGRIAKAIGTTNQLCVGWETVSDVSQTELLDGMHVNNSGPQIWACMTGKAEDMLLLPIGSINNSMMVLSAAEEKGSRLLDIAGQYQPSGIVGINRASDLQDAAAGFVKTMLSYDVQNSNNYTDDFPVNTQALADVMAAVNNSVSQSMRLDATNSLQALWPSETTRNALLGLLQSVNRPLATDNTLGEMLAPAVVAYLDGSDTLESAAGKMESVIATYLSE
jgi:hypothetical protein